MNPDQTLETQSMGDCRSIKKEGTSSGKVVGITVGVVAGAALIAVRSLIIIIPFG